MITEQQFLQALQIVNDYKIQIDGLVRDLPSEKFANQNRYIVDLDISVRLRNILLFGDFGLTQYESKVKDLASIPIRKLRATNNCGIGTINEFKDLCHSAGIIINDIR